MKAVIVLGALFVHTVSYADIAAPMPPASDVVDILQYEKQLTIEIYSGKNGVAREVRDIFVQAGIGPKLHRSSKIYEPSKNMALTESNFTRNRATGYTLWINVPSKDTFEYKNSKGFGELEKSGYSLTLREAAATTLLNAMKKAKIGGNDRQYPEIYEGTYRSVYCSGDKRSSECVLKIKK